MFWNVVGKVDCWGIRLQHGFRAWFSCETQLLETLDDLLGMRDKKYEVDVAVLDFS